MQNSLEERNMRLTEEEAMGLLELAMTCPLDLSLEQRSALVKLSEFCRQFMRADTINAKSEKAVEKNEVLHTPACAA